jgi:hypothetical protein
MHWGAPQPETVRDYRIESFDGAGWRELLAVNGNYQRRRVHGLSHPISTCAIRLQVLATNGIDHARVFEIRAYA